MPPADGDSITLIVDRGAASAEEDFLQQILVYSDSLSWGIIPGTRQRLEFEARWPGVMENELNRHQRAARVIENCLNGRRSVWEDPFKPGRNGHSGLSQCIEMHSPLALVVLMLGTNDFQAVHAFDAIQSAQGIAVLVAAIRQAPIEPGMPVPPILVVAPPPIVNPRGPLARKFAGAGAKSTGLAAAYRETAADLGCPFFDAGDVTQTSVVDGIHLDRDQHERFGKAMAVVAAALIAPALP